MGREEGSGWGTRVCLWQIHFDIWQNQYNIVKFKNKIKLKKKKERKKKDLQNQPKPIKKMAIGRYISIITLNINGLNAPTKRYRLAEWIQKQDP